VACLRFERVVVGTDEHARAPALGHTVQALVHERAQ
jgi:hypothetical protein